ncbi:MAG: VOC family protein [Alphaproteobacteria bacterium]
MISGINHINLSVGDLDKAIAFYQNVMGFKLKHQWDEGAYFDAGGLWLCLSLIDSPVARPQHDYTHYAFSIGQEDIKAFAGRLESHNIKQWKQNSSEGDSLYFLDPDGHKLEVHVGDMQSRLKHYIPAK